MTLLIEVVAGRTPPLFRWTQLIQGVGGAHVSHQEGYLPVGADAAVEQLVRTAHQLTADAATLRGQVAKLQAFKDWVHAYLDGRGVPHHPPGSHGAEGCRIGDRMDWLMAELEAARKVTAVISPAEATPASSGTAKLQTPPATPKRK